MILFLLAYLGGVRMIVSPGILPVLHSSSQRRTGHFCGRVCRCWLAWQRLSPLSPRSRFLDPGVQAYAFTFG